MFFPVLILSHCLFVFSDEGHCSDEKMRWFQVWDFNRSAEMRDTEGGASKRSVMEQVDKMRKYLAAEKVA